MISSIFNGLFICDSHSSLSEDQIVLKHSTMTHGSTQRALWITGTAIRATPAKQASKPTHTPVSETPRCSPLKGEEGQCHLAVDSGIICPLWVSSGFCFKTNSFSYFYFPQPAGPALILRLSTVSMETSIIWEPSWTSGSTHLILTSSKRQGWRRILWKMIFCKAWEYQELHF